MCQMHLLNFALNHDGELMEIVEDDAPMNSQR
jgi:hypothetical protein